MAISYTSNNITFNDVKQVPYQWNGMNGRKENGDFEYAEEDGVKYFINAVEIDWNAANLGSYIINTTAQLLSYMSNISEKISNIENILINL